MGPIDILIVFLRMVFFICTIGFFFLHAKQFSCYANEGACVCLTFVDMSGFSVFLGLFPSLFCTASPTIS